VSHRMTRIPIAIDHHKPKVLQCKAEWQPSKRYDAISTVNCKYYICDHLIIPLKSMSYFSRKGAILRSRLVTTEEKTIGYRAVTLLCHYASGHASKRLQLFFLCGSQSAPKKPLKSKRRDASKFSPKIRGSSIL